MEKAKLNNKDLFGLSGLKDAVNMLSEALPQLEKIQSSLTPEQRAELEKNVDFKKSNSELEKALNDLKNIKV